MKTICLVFGLLLSINIFACIGGYVHVNNDTTLLPEGIHGVADDVLYDIETLKKHGYFGKKIDLADKDGNITHWVMILGGHKATKIGQDNFASYLLKDLSTGIEKVYYLKHIEGAKSLNSPTAGGTQSLEFDSLMTSGC
jgi:hypothetical protein